MEQDLSSVKYVGTAMAHRLAEHGITTIEQLAVVSLDDLVAIQGIGEQTAPLIIASAQALLMGEEAVVEPAPAAMTDEVPDEVETESVIVDASSVLGGEDDDAIPEALEGAEAETLSAKKQKKAEKQAKKAVKKAAKKAKKLEKAAKKAAHKAEKKAEKQAKKAAKKAKKAAKKTKAETNLAA